MGNLNQSPTNCEARQVRESDLSAGAYLKGRRRPPAPRRNPVGSRAHQLLADLGCDVIEAPDATQALLLLQTHRVDLVFSDIVMPGMSGLEILRRLARFTGQCPFCSPAVIAASSSSPRTSGNSRSCASPTSLRRWRPPSPSWLPGPQAQAPTSPDRLSLGLRRRTARRRRG